MKICSQHSSGLWFTTLSMFKNNWQGLLKHGFLGPTPKGSDLGGLW